MYGDEKISVETYCDKLKTQMLSVLHVFSLHLHNSKLGYNISTWVSPQKVHVEGKMLGM